MSCKIGVKTKRAPPGLHSGARTKNGLRILGSYDAVQNSKWKFFLRREGEDPAGRRQVQTKLFRPGMGGGGGGGGAENV